jgi:N6-adenosine-specific RNA methylase IME4
MRLPRVLVADPAWGFRDKLPGRGRGAAKHYRVQTLDEIKAFELPKMAPDSWLFLWRVAAMQREAIEVMDAWGFRLVSEVAWVKTRKDGQPHGGGMGHYVRNSHEVCLIGVRGKASAMRLSKAVPSVIFARSMRHSEKPEAFYQLVERLVPGPRVELFARRRRRGWKCFGDELGRGLAA